MMVLLYKYLPSIKYGGVASLMFVAKEGISAGTWLVHLESSLVDWSGEESACTEGSVWAPVIRT
jgi:hypothetical protein